MDLSSFFQYPESESGDDSRDVLFLPNWAAEQWRKLLAHTETRRFTTGQVVIQPGEVDRSLYVITTGSLEVLIPHGRSGKLHRLALVEAGSIIGEQAFLDGRPRSATVRALADGEMLRLSLDAFEVFSMKHADLARDLLFDLGRILSIRLRHTEQFISSWVG